MEFKRLQDQAYDYLKERILSGKWESGVIYSETKLAEEIGISRTPIRDALRKLSHDGFIDIMPSRGFMLHQISSEEITQIYQMRSAIEGYCALLLTQQHKMPEGQKTIKTLETLLSQLSKLIHDDADLDKIVSVDHEFHIQIVAHAQNPVFSDIFYNNLHRMHVLAVDSMSYPGRKESALKEHRDILEVITVGNIDNVYKTTLIHMETPKYINFELFKNKHDLKLSKK